MWMRGWWLFTLSFLMLTFSSCKKEQITLITQQVDSHTNYQLHDISFVNDSVGYICGGSRYAIGIILKTRNGGRTWTTPDSIMPKCAYTNYFFNASEGFAGAYDSWMAYTSDSGKTFVAATSNWSPINDMDFSDRQHGVKIGGDGYASGYIGYTLDGGANWAITNYPNNFRAVCFSDDHTVFASGYGVIYKSLDKGEHFEPLDIRGDFFVAMDFPSAQTGFIAGYQGMILRMTDGGNSFKKVRAGNAPFGSREHFEGVDFWDDYLGYVVGDGGSMYRTTDGGENWKKVSPFTSSNLREVHLFSETSGIVVGDDGAIFLFKE